MRPFFKVVAVLVIIGAWAERDVLVLACGVVIYGLASS